MRTKKAVMVLAVALIAIAGLFAVFGMDNEFLEAEAADGDPSADIYVDDDADPGWYDATHVHTVQEGVDNATAGDTVFVYNGTYDENIVMNKRVNLVGENRKSAIIEGAGSGDVVYVSGDGINITGFTIKGGDHGGIVLSSSSSSNIKDCLVYNNSYVGVDIVDNSSNATIHDCEVGYNNAFGLLVFGNSNNNIIQDCIFHHQGDDGIRMGGENHNNTIQNCTFTNNNVYGCLMAECSYNLVKNCTFTSNQNALFLHHDARNHIISDCEIFNNEGGISMDDCYYNLVQDCNVSYNVASGIEVGDYSHHNQFRNCDISQNSIGIRLTTYCRANLVSNCRCDNNNYSGIRMICGAHNNTIENCYTLKNGVDGISAAFSAPYNLIKNCTAASTGGGFVVSSSNHSLILNCSSYNNAYGVDLTNASHNLVKNCYCYNNKLGVRLHDSKGPSMRNTIQNCTLSNNSWSGIQVKGSHHNIIIDNKIKSNSEGIYLDSSDNLIYNNYLHNTNNAYDDGNNTWNISKTDMVNGEDYNIVGGDWFGGNYWSDYNGTDTDGDGLGDTNLPYNCSGNIPNGGDYHPLVTGEQPPEADIYVDDDADPSWYDATHVRIVQEGIDNASAGDTVFVYNGTYYENVLVDKTVDLIGEDRNGTIIDGGGSGSVVKATADNITISGFRVKNSGSNWEDAGIKLYGVQQCRIENTTVTNNNGDGIRLYSSNNSTISGNTISNSSSQGIFLSSSSNNTFTDNTMVDDVIVIRGKKVEHWDTHTIDTSNTVNGKPVYYWKNVYGAMLPTGAGQIILANCTNITIENQDNSKGCRGIQIGFSLNCTIRNYSVSTNTGTGGIWLSFSSGCAITGNTITNNNAPFSYDGISLLCSSGCAITGNTITNQKSGIFLLYASNCSIIGNTIANNTDGILVSTCSSGCAITGNTITDNTKVGIEAAMIFYVSRSNSIDSGSSNSCSITGNILSNNGEGIHLVSGFDATIYHNNFVNNTNNAYAYNAGDSVWFNANLKEGNYWSDYDEASEGAYDNNNDGIVDSPYNISGGDNQDLYPSIAPYDLIDVVPPVISKLGVSPDPQRQGVNVTISSHVTDNLQVSDVKVNITYPEGRIVKEVMMKTADGYSYHTTFSHEGIYEYRIWARDNSGNTNLSDVHEFHICAVANTTNVTEGENTVNATDSCVQVQINASTNTSVGIGNYSINPSEGMPSGTVAVGRYVEVTIENESAVQWPVYLAIYYTQSDLNDAGLTEDEIRGMYYYDDDAGMWRLYNTTGINTTDVTVDGQSFAGYVWAYAWPGQLSPKVIGGKPSDSPTPPSPPTPPSLPDSDELIDFDGPAEWNQTHWDISSETLICFDMDVAEDAGITELYYRIDNGSWMQYDGCFSVPMGMHSIYYYGIDSHGRHTNTARIVINVVTSVAPITTCDVYPPHPPKYTGWYTDAVTVSLYAVDSVSGVSTTYYRFNEGNWLEYTGEIVVATDGRYTLEYYSVDNAGNEEAIQSTSFKIDKTAPAVSFKQPSQGHLYLLGREILPLGQTVIIGQATLAVDAIDDTAGIKQVEFYVDGELQDTVKEQPFELVWDEMAFFKHTIKAGAIDKAGNRAAVEQEIWIFNL